METIIHWLETHQLSCFYKSHLGIDCPGCGMQRAFILLLKGDLSASFITYPPLPFLLILFAFLFLQLIFKFKKGGTYVMFAFIAAALAVLVNFALKLFSQ